MAETVAQRAARAAMRSPSPSHRSSTWRSVSSSEPVVSMTTSAIGEARLVGHLRGDAGRGIRFAHAPQLDEPPQPHLGRRVRHDDELPRVVDARLDEQRHVVDDDGVRVGRERRREAPRRLRAHGGVHDRVQPRDRRRRRRRPRAPSAARSSEPSARSIRSPNSAAIAASTGEPGCCTSRTIWSASTMTAP